MDRWPNGELWCCVSLVRCRVQERLFSWAKSVLVTGMYSSTIPVENRRTVWTPKIKLLCLSTYSLCFPYQTYVFRIRHIFSFKMEGVVREWWKVRWAISLSGGFSLPQYSNGLLNSKFYSDEWNLFIEHTVVPYMFFFTAWFICFCLVQ